MLFCLMHRSAHDAFTLPARQVGTTSSSLRGAWTRATHVWRAPRAPPSRPTPAHTHPLLLRGSSLPPQLPAPLDLHPYRDAVTVTVAPTLTLARTRTLTLARTRTRTLARTHNPNPYPNPNPNPRWFVLHPDK